MLIWGTKKALRPRTRALRDRWCAIRLSGVRPVPKPRARRVGLAAAVPMWFATDLVCRNGRCRERGTPLKCAPAAVVGCSDEHRRLPLCPAKLQLATKCMRSHQCGVREGRRAAPRRGYARRLFVA